LPDVIYKSEEAKFRGITLQVLKCYGTGQPVLVGTRSIAVSERISDRLISERLQLLAAIELIAQGWTLPRKSRRKKQTSITRC